MFFRSWWTLRESNSCLSNANAAFYHLTKGPLIKISVGVPRTCFDARRVELGLKKYQEIFMEYFSYSGKSQCRGAENRTRSSPASRPRMCPTHPEKFFCRDAGNRTRSSRTRSARTTGILHPDQSCEKLAHMLEILHRPELLICLRPSRPAMDKAVYPCAPCRARTCDLTRVKGAL